MMRILKDNSSPLSSLITGVILVCAAAVGVTGCKVTETTRKTNDEPAARTDAPDNVDEAPVTVMPGGERVRASDVDLPAVDNNAGGEGVWVPEAGDFVLRDRQTGSYWNLRGEAYRGPLKGETLEQVSAFNSFWFAWSVFYHGSEIWQRDAENIRNTPGAIESDGTCLVPCDDIEMGCPSKDCIPALDYAARSFAGQERPKEAEMVEPGAEGTEYLEDSDFVFGVTIDGEARAYPHNIYWWHEIHNDRIGETEYAVTFCPLTGSGIVFEGQHNDGAIRYGVSGRLYNANLVMFDEQTGTFWSQMLGRGIKGELRGDRLKRMPVVETTWERWKEMYPETLVTSSKTGYDRSYASYPYGGYRTNHDRTFRAEEHQDTYKAKERVLGLPGESKSSSLAFAFPEMDGLEGDRNVIHETFEGEPVVVVYEAEHRMAIPFRTAVDGQQLSFVGTVAGASENVE